LRPAFAKIFLQAEPDVARNGRSVVKLVMRTDLPPSQEPETKPLELNFYLRRAKGPGVFVVGADSLTESIVVIGPTLRDLRRALAERIAAEYGSDVSIRLYVGSQPVPPPPPAPAAMEANPKVVQRQPTGSFDDARA
jgi:hypothetical protein